MALYKDFSFVIYSASRISSEDKSSASDGLSFFGESRYFAHSFLTASSVPDSWVILVVLQPSLLSSWRKENDVSFAFK